jgi:hypothetical protein
MKQERCCTENTLHVHRRTIGPAADASLGGKLRAALGDGTELLRDLRSLESVFPISQSEQSEPYGKII